MMLPGFRGGLIGLTGTCGPEFASDRLRSDGTDN